MPLGRELDVLERYLDIQRIRIGARLSIEIDVPVDLRRAAVPAMILQPLAENAIRHGIDTAPGAGVLRLRARRDGDTLALELFNTAAGASFARCWRRRSAEHAGEAPPALWRSVLLQTGRRDVTA